jgi:hypothetical protein
MFDFLMAWVWSYNAMFVAGCVFGFIVGFGTRDLWLIRHPDLDEIETASAAYEDEPQTDDDAIARRLLNY